MKKRKLKEPKVIGGFRFPNSPIQWVFDYAIHDTLTMEQLLERFYSRFISEEPEDEYTYKPITFVRDPEKEGKRIYGDNTNFIVVIYPKGFHCVIEKQFREIYGPHACKLFWKNDDELMWVATLQICEMFFSDDKILAALATAIKKRQFFQSEETKIETLIIS